MSLSPSKLKEQVSFISTQEIDKIVNVYEGSFDVASATTVGGYLKRHSFEHDFTRPVFTKLQWSIDNESWIDGGFSYESGDANRYPSIAYSDSDNIYILTGRTSGTLYYRVIATWIEEYDDTDPWVESFVRDVEGKRITFDSRTNYQKVWMRDVETASGSSETVEVTHGLGYRPNHRVYFEAFPGEIWPAIAGGAQNYFLYDFTNTDNSQGELEVSVTDQKLTLEWAGVSNITTPRRIWYRIYTDGG